MDYLEKPRPDIRVLELNLKFIRACRKYSSKTSNVRGLNCQDKQPSASSPPPVTPTQLTPSQAATFTKLKVVSARKRRVEPLCTYCGTYRQQGVLGQDRNAVYISRERNGRIQRRISKETVDGRIVTQTRKGASITSHLHDNIAYIPRWHGKTKCQVDDDILPSSAVKPLPYIDTPFQLTWHPYQYAIGDAHDERRGGHAGRGGRGARGARGGCCHAGRTQEKNLR